MHQLHAMEMSAVRGQVRIGRSGPLRPFALALSHLGNGWLYPLLAVLLLWRHPHAFRAIALAGAIAAGTAHVIYAWIKRKVARPRPCDLDPELRPLLRALDRYAFPSGHCMTVTAIAIPVSVALPDLALMAGLACVLIAWARIVAAHHYPSDTVAGMVLGAAVSVPVTLLLL